MKVPGTREGRAVWVIRGASAHARQERRRTDREFWRPEEVSTRQAVCRLGAFSTCSSSSSSSSGYVSFTADKVPEQIHQPKLRTSPAHPRPWREYLLPSQEEVVCVCICGT